MNIKFCFSFLILNNYLLGIAIREKIDKCIEHFGIWINVCICHLRGRIFSVVSNL